MLLCSILYSLLKLHKSILWFCCNINSTKISIFNCLLLNLEIQLIVYTDLVFCDLAKPTYYSSSRFLAPLRFYIQMILSSANKNSVIFSSTVLYTFSFSCLIVWLGPTYSTILNRNGENGLPSLFFLLTKQSTVQRFRTLGS